MPVINFVSQSSVNQFYRCQEQWRRRWLENEIIPPGIAARRGTGLHHAAKINHIQKIESRIDLPLSDLQDAARDEYVRVIKDEGVFIPKDQVSSSSKLISDGLDAAVRLTEAYYKELAPKIQPIMAEERQTVDIGLSAVLAGTIDVVDENEWMPDFKTAAKSKGINEAHKSLQLTFYAGLYYSKFGKWPKKLSLEILVDSKEPKLKSLETTRTADDWQKLITRIQLMLAQVETGIFLPCEPDNWMCSEKWCGYYNSCRYSLNRR